MMDLPPIPEGYIHPFMVGQVPEGWTAIDPASLPPYVDYDGICFARKAATFAQEGATETKGTT